MHDTLRVLNESPDFDMSLQSAEGFDVLSHMLSPGFTRNEGVSPGFKYLLYQEDVMLDLNRIDGSGRTLLMKATMAKGYPRHTELLLRLGADPAMRSHDGKTALHFAAMILENEEQSMLIENTKLLIDKGADLHSLDAEGWTPTDLVRQMNSHDAIPKWRRILEATGVNWMTFLEREAEVHFGADINRRRLVADLFTSLSWYSVALPLTAVLLSACVMCWMICSRQ